MGDEMFDRGLAKPTYCRAYLHDMESLRLWRGLRFKRTTIPLE